MVRLFPFVSISIVSLLLCLHRSRISNGCQLKCCPPRILLKVWSLSFGFIRMWTFVVGMCICCACSNWCQPDTSCELTKQAQTIPCIIFVFISVKASNSIQTYTVNMQDAAVACSQFSSVNLMQIFLLFLLLFQTHFNPSKQLLNLRSLLAKHLC